MLKPEEIMRMQNRIVLEEFKKNYNKTESQRVIEELGEPEPELVVNLQKELQNQIKGDYIVRVSHFGVITISKMEREMSERLKCDVQTVVSTIRPTIEMPYGYVMGKKIGKKAMQEIVARYEPLC